jgi:cytochrome c oxidase subunit 3
MSAAPTTDRPVDHQDEVDGSPLTVGAVLWLASELMLFAGFFAAYFTLKGATEVWPPAGVDLQPARPAVFTALFVCSAVTVWLAVRAARAGKLAESRAFMVVTGLLGLLFAVDTFFELRDVGFGIDTDAYGSIFWILIGVHWLHVLVGLFLIGVIMAITQGRSGVPNDTVVTVISYYWYFLVALSIAVFAVLYLIQ